MENTGLESKDLKRTLLSLALGKTKVIYRHKNPNQQPHSSPEIFDNDIFTFNDDFKHENYKFQINQVLDKDDLDKPKTDANDKLISEAVKNNLSIQIDAALVRICKKFNKITHVNLMSELLGQKFTKQFEINVNDVKKRIESLIDRDFIVREHIDEEEGYAYVS